VWRNHPTKISGEKKKPTSKIKKRKGERRKSILKQGRGENVDKNLNH
jgi:hypothetical protein